MHVEAMLLLCTTFWGREYLRAHGVYQVIRALHEDEKVDKVAEHVERLVNFLKRDEGSDTKHDDETSIAAAVSGPAGAHAEEDEEDEDEDSRIEEI